MDFVGLLRRLRRLAPLLSFDTLWTAVSATILSRLDYGNSVYLELPSCLLDKLQVFHNDEERLLFKVPCSSHASPFLRKLHWLPIQQQILFKSLCTVHRAINGSGPAFISDQILRYQPVRLLHSSM